MIRVTGQLVKKGELWNEEVVVELPPIDISKIKEGDEVWVKAKVGRIFGGKVIGLYYTAPNGINKKDLAVSEEQILVHFPSPAKEYCKCEEPKPSFGNYEFDTKDFKICMNEGCKKFIKPLPPEPDLREKLINTILKVAMAHHDDISKQDEDRACDAADQILSLLQEPKPQQQIEEIEPIEKRLARIEKYILELLNKTPIIIQKELTQDDWLRIMNKPLIC